MKKILYTALLAIIGMVATSCNNEADRWEPKVNDLSNLNLITCYEANYMGDEYETGSGLITLKFVAGEMDYTGKPKGAANLMKLDCFIEIADDPDNAILTPGTYRVGGAMDGVPSTFAGYAGDGLGTYVELFDENGARMVVGVTDGEFTVAHQDGKYTLSGKFTDESGTDINWKYEGLIPINNYHKLTTDPNDFFILRLYDSENRQVDYLGDIDGTGTAKIEMQFMAKMTMTGIHVTFYTELPADGKPAIKPGEYKISNTPGAEFTIVKGEKSAIAGNATGTYDFIYQGNARRPQNLAESGSMIVAVNDKGEYDIIFDFEGQNMQTTYDAKLSKYRYMGTLPFENKAPKAVNFDVKSDEFKFEATAGYWGEQPDAPGLGSYNIMLRTGDIYTANSKHVSLELYGPKPADEDNATMPDGRYTVNPKKEDHTCFPGYIMNSQLYGTYFTHYPTVYERDLYRSESGTVMITNKGGNTYEVTGELTGTSSMHANQTGIVKFTYTGTLIVENRIDDN